MKLKYSGFILLLLTLILTACSGGNPDTAEPDPAGPTAETHEEDATAEATTAVEATIAPATAQTVVPAETAVNIPPATLPTAEAPTGTVLELTGNEMHLSHANFNWLISLPADWIITYDSGFQLAANSPDQAVFIRLQAQRWGSVEGRLPNARAYVDHWKNFTYGDVFPLFADGEQLAENETASDKYGGPYLQYEFLDNVDDLHYSQIYASGGGPTSAVLTVWTAGDDYDDVRAIIQTILSSFEIVESSE